MTHRGWAKSCRYGLLASRLTLGGAFIYAGLMKFGGTADFAENIASFHLLAAPLNNLLAIGLPPYEMILGVWLVMGWKTRPAAFCAMVACGGFLFALVSAWARGIPVDCGCFGSASNNGPTEHHAGWAIGRDLLLLAVAGIVYLANWRREPAV